MRNTHIFQFYLIYLLAEGIPQAPSSLYLSLINLNHFIWELETDKIPKQ